MKTELKDTETRLHNANRYLIEICRQYTDEYAPELAALFIHERAVKLDVNMGTYKFAHGAWLDDDVIARCIERIKEDLKNA